jgi:D-glycero-D-manno-heptose 1,7-bisphosphate phosphatase
LIERALFVDRDGVLNQIVMRGEVVSSPRNWEEFRWLRGLERLPELKRLGYRLILISNQPDIERGLLSLQFLDEVNAQLLDRFNFDAIYVCPYASNSHPWKKPNIGLFQKAAGEFGLNLTRSFMLGDTSKDMDAARNARCGSILWDQPHNQSVHADHRISSFAALEALLSRAA